MIFGSREWHQVEEIANRRIANRKQAQDLLLYEAICDPAIGDSWICDLHLLVRRLGPNPTSDRPGPPARSDPSTRQPTRARP